MKIVTVRPSSNPALARAENSVQARRAADVVREMQAQTNAQIAEIERRLEEDPFLQMPLEHREYLATRLEGFLQLERRLGNAWGEVLGVLAMMTRTQHE